MTTQQLILISCLYLAELVIVTYFTRATARRIAGALAGGATVGLFGLGAIVLGNAFEFWRVPIFWTPSFLPLFYLGFVISGYPNLPRYLAGGSAIRRARTGGVYRCRGDHRPAARLLIAAKYPAWMVFAPGIAPILADAAAYVGMVAIGHAVMRLVAGPAREDRLRNKS